MLEAHTNPFRNGMFASIPLLISFSISFTAFGALCATQGISSAQALGMTALLFAGPAQFAVVSGISTGSTITAAVLAILIINLRFSLMSFQLSQKFKNVSRAALLSAVPLLSASTFALSFAQAEVYDSGRDRFRFFLGAGISAYACAVFFTGIGANFSTLLPLSVTKAAFGIIPIYFSTVFAGERTRPAHLFAGLAAAIGGPLLHSVFPTFGGVIVPIFVGVGFCYFTRKKQS